MPVSVLVPTLNEGKNLAACLEHLSWADEVVVIDSGSTDETLAIAGRFGAKVIKIMVDAKPYGYTADEMKPFISEAAKSGLKVAGHVQTRAGAMRAIELVKDRATKEPAEAATRKVLAACHRRGLLIISAGTFGNVIRMLVPLVATDAQIEEGLLVLEQALAEIHVADTRGRDFRGRLGNAAAKHVAAPYPRVGADCKLDHVDVAKLDDLDEWSAHQFRDDRTATG